jgi:hypothetical protein
MLHGFQCLLGKPSLNPGLCCVCAHMCTPSAHAVSGGARVTVHMFPGQGLGEGEREENLAV